MAGTVPTRVPCTYSNCKHFFSSVNEMKRHKANTAEHEYCSRCDEDFQSEEHLLIHKIKSDKHIVCPVCGIEFKSEGGRDIHIRQNHRASQNLICHGCKCKFKSASGLIRHIEDDDCPVISQSYLLVQQSKKLLLKEALEYGESVSFKDIDDADGGMSLSAIEFGNREALENQPGIWQDKTDPTSSVSAMLAAKHWPLPGERRKKAPRSAMSDLISFSEISIAPDDKENSGWKGKGKVPSVIDSESTIAPPPSVKSQDVGQMLRALDRNWDPTKFFNSFSGFYVCPCGKELTTVKEFEEHVLTKSKANRRVQCPGCLRVFKTTAALIAHCESATTRCDINDGDKYGQIIDEITGGVVQTAGYNEDGTLKYEAGNLDLKKTITVGVDLRKPEW